MFVLKIQRMSVFLVSFVLFWNLGREEALQFPSLPVRNNTASGILGRSQDYTADLRRIQETLQRQLSDLNGFSGLGDSRFGSKDCSASYGGVTCPQNRSLCLQINSSYSCVEHCPESAKYIDSYQGSSILPSRKPRCVVKCEELYLEKNFTCISNFGCGQKNFYVYEDECVRYCPWGSNDALLKSFLFGRTCSKEGFNTNITLLVVMLVVCGGFIAVYVMCFCQRCDRFHSCLEQNWEKRIGVKANKKYREKRNHTCVGEV